ncbi:MAG: phenylacetate-CoA oxygenase subunit PaaJ [Chloroflexi bacterium UTCFX4]|jgi:ring-1,2-phenylacetyl-CoA epoxidase subunit PaaD|nr:MAG: phenylacetate-CoA oxygenase subunit PaaJ [Chloroflexi bacterium UTCFX4]
MVTLQEIWRALDEVVDPEIPVVSLVEMGIVRDVQIDANGVTVSMTPTFAGCPALGMMRNEIVEKLRGLGIARVEVKTILNPPWSSDMIADSARAKLKTFGLAPPPRHGGDVQLFFPAEVACPCCGSTDTRVTNPFGPTLCRAIYFCRGCQQPFEKFKAL